MSFQKFMNKKDFHPGSYRNIKLLWQAEEKAKASKKKEDDMRLLYDREQEMYRNRQQMAGSETSKLQLNFMYDLPPGLKKEAEKEEELDEKGQPKLKFDWQKEGRQAPRESYARDMELRDQPFGIEVRNVRCFRCHKWGHVNTDKICPLYNVAKEEDKFVSDSDPLKLIHEMRLDGFAMKRSLVTSIPHSNHPLHQFVASDDDDDDLAADEAYLATLSDKQKRKLLRKLEKMEEAGLRGSDSADGVATTYRADRGAGKKKKKTKDERDRRDKKRCRSVSRSDDENDEGRRERKRRRSEEGRWDEGRRHESRWHGDKHSKSRQDESVSRGGHDKERERGRTRRRDDSYGEQTERKHEQRRSSRGEEHRHRGHDREKISSRSADKDRHSSYKKCREMSSDEDGERRDLWERRQRHERKYREDGKDRHPE